MVGEQTRATRYASIVVCTVLAVGCAREAGPPAAADTPQPAAATVPTAGPVRPPRQLGSLDAEQLRERAGIATQEGRVHAPVGDNAVEYYLALRERGGDAGPTGLALQELQPYVVIGAELALAAGSWPEVERLIGLLERVDPQAPSIPRLATELAAGRARDAAARAERDALAAEAAASAASAARPAQPAPASTPTRAPAAVPSPVVRAASDEVVAGPTAAERAGVERRPEPMQTASQAARVPRLLTEVPARYPPVARNRRLEGNVVVQFTVQTDGSVANISVVASDPPGVFDRAAAAAVAGYRFDTGSVPATIRRTLEFRLQPRREGG